MYKLHVQEVQMYRRYTLKQCKVLYTYDPVQNINHGIETNITIAMTIRVSNKGVGLMP